MAPIQETNVWINYNQPKLSIVTPNVFWMEDSKKSLDLPQNNNIPFQFKDR